MPDRWWAYGRKKPRGQTRTWGGRRGQTRTCAGGTRKKDLQPQASYLFFWLNDFLLSAWLPFFDWPPLLTSCGLPFSFVMWEMLRSTMSFCIGHQISQASLVASTLSLPLHKLFFLRWQRRHQTKTYIFAVIIRDRQKLLVTVEVLADICWD